MTENLSEELKKYFKLCVQLSKEITQNIADIEFEKNGGKIHYCVDFSEIFSYVHLQRELFELDFFLSEDFYERQTIINEYILDTIYSSLNRKIILLNPYAIEFESFLHKIRSKVVVKIVQEAGYTLLGFDDILKEEDIKPIIKLAHETKEENRELTAEELDLCLQFFEKHLKSLVYLVEGRSIEPLRRLNMLLEKKCFVELERSINIDVNPNDDFINFWFERLNRLREPQKAASNFIDAVAMAIIRKVNKLWKNSGKKLILITRSKNMHKIFNYQLNEGLWDNYGGNVLRHPRCFSPFHYPIKKGKVDIKHLNWRKNYLELFVDSVKKEQIVKKYDSFSKERKLKKSLSEVIYRLKNDWIRTEAIYASISESSKYASGAKSSKEKQVYDILSLLNNTTEIRLFLTKFLEQIELMFERENELLGWMLLFGNHNAREVVDNQIRMEDYPGKLVLSSNNLTMPYSIQFSSEKLQERMQKISRWEITWQDLFELFREGIRTENGYERLLAMSFTVGALGKWELARKYCEKALMEGKREEGIQLNEGCYFLAVCLRRTAQSPIEYQKALDLLQEAQNIKKQIKNQPQYEDLRYIAERASVIYYWNKYIEKENVIEGENVPSPKVKEKVPDIKEFLDICRYILAKDFDDKRLRIRIKNNLCFYYADEGGEEEKKEALILLDELREDYLLVQPDEARWPPSIIDTVVWVNFKLNQKQISLEELKNSAERLNNLLRRPEVPIDDKYIFSEHIQVIRGEIERRRINSNTTRP